MLNMQILYGPLTKKCDIEQIEKNTEESYQTCHFTKKMPYKERLLRLNLYTLKYRRLRGDMIEVFIIVHNVYDNRVHHYYLIMIRMLLEVTSLSYKIIVLIIILENFSFLQE